MEAFESFRPTDCKRSISKPIRSQSYYTFMNSLERNKSTPSEDLASTSHAESSNPELKLDLAQDEENFKKKYSNLNLQKILEHKHLTLNELHTLKRLFDKVGNEHIDKKRNGCRQKFQTKEQVQAEVTKWKQHYKLHTNAIEQKILQKEAENTHPTE